MARLPKRTRKHVLEEESKRFVENIIPAEWSITKPDNDYGLDLQVEIVLNENVTGAVWSIQLKATDKIVYKDNHIIHRCKTSTLNYFLSRPERVIYLVYDAINKKAYWIWIQEYIRNDLDKKWEDQETAMIRIPEGNIFDKTAVEEIKKRVIHDHQVQKWLSAVQTIRNPHFRYSLDTDGEGIGIGIAPRYTGAELDMPVEISGTFRFDDSDEGKEALQSLRDALEKGTPAEFDSRFFEGFGIPTAFSDIFPRADNFKTSKLFIQPIPNQHPHIVSFSFFDEIDNEVFKFPYIEFIDIQSGTKEITFTNAAQKQPMVINMIVSEIDNTIELTFTPRNWEGNPISKVSQAIDFFHKLGNIKLVRITYLKTGDIIESSIPDKTTTIIPPHITHLINALVLIQDRTQVEFTWPSSLTNTEAAEIFRVATMISDGHIRLNGIISLPINKTFGRNFLNAYQPNQKHQFLLTSENQNVEILGKAIDLGEHRIHFPDGWISDTDFQAIEQLVNNGAADETIVVDINSGDEGIIVSLPRWSSQIAD